MGQFGVAVGLLHQLANEVVDVRADVAGLAELGGVGFDEGNADEIRDMLDEVSLAHACRADNDDVLLSEFHLASP